MRSWELHDGEQAGSADEARVLTLIADGLPASTMIRQVGEAEWQSLRTHAPFAAALDRAKATAAQADADEPAKGVPPPLLERPVSGKTAALALLGVVVLAAVIAFQLKSPVKVVTSAEMPPAPPHQVQQEQPGPIELILKKKTAAEAFALAAPMMVDKFNAASPGTALFALWSMKNLRWQDVGVGGDETSYARIQKDVDAERGRRLCAPGTIIEIAVSKDAYGTAYVGLLMSDAMNTFHFFAVRSTGDLVEQSPARFCGLVTGRYEYRNSAGGTGHAVEMVGMFDLPGNRLAK